MVIINVSGGLGNQMFQYAMYIAMKEYGKDVRLSLRHYELAIKGKKIPDHGKRYLIEDVFDTQAVLASEEDIRRLGQVEMDVLSRGLRKLHIYKKSYIMETMIKSVSMKSLLEMDEVFLDGYWQDFSLWKEKEKEVREKLIFKNPLSVRNEDLKEKMTEEESVSLHVRRNDYLKNSIYQAQNPIYYRTAMEFIRKKCNNPVFYCFSDDIAWCRKEFGDEAIQYVNWNHGRESYADMQLMSLCKHNIVTNSSFSVWSAWLNQNSNKIVIRPQEYYTTGVQYNWPKDWLTVDHDE